MNRLALFLVLALSCGCSWALSDFQKFNHLKPEQKEVSPLELFASPFQPGGKYGLSVNILNALRWVAPESKIVKKMDGGKGLVDRWAEGMVACDPELRALWNDDRPYESKEARLAGEARIKALKAEKLKKYQDEGAEMAAKLGWNALPSLPKLPKIKEPKKEKIPKEKKKK